MISTTKYEYKLETIVGVIIMGLLYGLVSLITIVICLTIFGFFFIPLVSFITFVIILNKSLDYFDRKYITITI